VKKLRETKDCIKSFARRVTSAGMLSQAEMDAIDKTVLANIDDAVAKAKAAPKPSAKDLLTDVYTSY